MKLFSGKTAGYGRLQLFSGAPPQRPGDTPTGALLWEGPVELEMDRRVATLLRRVRGNGVRFGGKTPVRRLTGYPLGRRATDKNDHKDRRDRDRCNTINLRRRAGEERRGVDTNLVGICHSLRYVMHLPLRRKKDERRDLSRQYISKCLHRRVGDTQERRGALSHTRRYSSSTDPRIRALERRKA